MQTQKQNTVIKDRDLYDAGKGVISSCVSVLVCIIFSIVITLSSSVYADTIITNSATVNFSINGTPQSLSDSVQFTKDTVVTPSDTITLSKQVTPSNAYVGDIVTYTLQVSNPNNNSLNNILIQDTFSTSLHYVAGSAKLNNTAINTNQVNYAGNLLTVSIGSMPANTTWTIKYHATANTTGSLNNSAFASSDSAISLTDNAIVNITTRPIIVPSVSPLALSKEANTQLAKLGDIVKYTLSIKNPNNKAITDAKLIDNLPSELSYVLGSAQLNSVPITTISSESLAFKIGNIPASASWILTYDAKVESTTNKYLTNQANITSSDVNTNSNIAKATIEVSDEIISLNKVANKSKAVIGDTVEYTISVTNPTDHDLHNLIIKDNLPSGFMYQTGSASINGQSFSKLQQNGQLLQFNINNLAKKQTLNLQYKVILTDGATPGNAINTAQASSNLAISDVVGATVSVRTPSTIKLLKVNENGTQSNIPLTSYNDNQNGGKHWQEITSIILADGTTAFLPSPQPLVTAGQFTLADPIIIEVQDLDQNTDPNAVDTIFITINDPETGDKEILLLQETSPNSGVFRGAILTTTDATNIQNGILSIKGDSQINVHYRDTEDSTDSNKVAAFLVPKSTMILEKLADKESASLGELVRFTITAQNRTDASIPNFELIDTLPLGFKLITGSTTLNGETLHSGITTNAQTITFKLGKIPLGETWTVEYLTKISSGVQVGKVVNTVVLNNERFQSNIAKATINIKDDLMRSKNILTGRVYIGCNTGKESKFLEHSRIFNETGRSVLTDKHGFWHMENIQAGTHVFQLDKDSLPSGYEAILCKNNTRKAGNPNSQFVNLQKGALWQVDFHVKKGLNRNNLDNPSNNKDKKNKTFDPIKHFGKSYVESAPVGFEILWPKDNYVPPIASTKIVVRTSPEYKTEVYLNNKKVSPMNYEGSSTNKLRTITVRRWKGVDIDSNKKNNTLLVILKNKLGKEVARKTHNIHFSSQPASAEFLADESTLVADGKTTPVIVLRIRDGDGFPMRANTHGYYNIENNRFQIKRNDSEDEEINLNKSQAGNFTYQIEEGGIARIKLNPTTQSGELKLNLQFHDSTNKVIRAWLKPKLREWIIVGLVEGTVAHNTLSGNMKALSSLDKVDGISKNGRVAFFAKGKVKGKYLLTVAYDTHKATQKVGSQLEGNIDPDAWYTLYADNSSSQHNAPSSNKLYLKIEKENFYTLLGDYRTDMSVTQLAKYERTLNGIKSQYRGETISYNAFISQTTNKHHHDEIPADGSSGLYHLSHDIVSNSEIIRIETRDRFHSERIVSTQEFTRYQDYDIDYNTGALFFKFPVAGRDKDLNPNIIVVDYDSETDSNKEIIAGGRISAKTNNENIEVGISALNIGQNGSNNDTLIAIDADYKITKDLKLHAEMAQSKTKKSEFKSINAQVLELEKQIRNIEAKIYYHKQGKSFGIDSQVSEAGTQKLGAEVRYKINDKTKLNAEISTEKNLNNNNTNQLAEASIKHRLKKLEISAGIRHTKEDLNDEILSNNTVLLGAKYTTDNNKVTFRSNLEKNIGSSNNSEISPDRIIVGVDIKLNQGVTLFTEHETTKNKKTTTHNTRVGVSKNLWKGAKGRTTYTQEKSAEGQRNYATLGLVQKIKITDKLSADFSIDRAKTIGATQKKFNDQEPNRQGSQTDDYTAFSVGLGSNDKDWNWTSRFEIRNGEIKDKVNFIASVIRRLENGKQVSGKLSYYNTENENGSSERISKLSFGSAWHPKDRGFVLFSRLDLIDEKSNLTASGSKKVDTRTQKIIHNMHFSHKLNPTTQISVHHGIKRIIDQNKNTKHSATIDTGTIELRRDINNKWDVGVKGGYLHDWAEKTTEVVAGVSVGVTPAENAWIEFGYNFEGFNDEDFDQNNYKLKGPYASFRFKFD